MRYFTLSVVALILAACGDNTEIENSITETAPPQVSRGTPMPAPAKTIKRLDNPFKGPAYERDTTAIDAMLNAVQDADQSRLQKVWSRMQPAQKLAANDAVREWVKDLEDDEFDRIAATYELLNQVDWAGVYAQNEADKATAGLAFGDLHGVVIDPATNAPVQGMTISAAHAEHGIGPKMLASTVQAVTDADGRFELTHIPSGEINIVGLLPTYILQNATAQIVADQTVKQTYQATRLDTPKVDVLFAGEVVDAVTGHPVASASVFLNKRVNRTKANGRFIFNTPPGSYRVRVEHPDYHDIDTEVTTPTKDAFRQDYELQPMTLAVQASPEGYKTANKTAELAAHSSATTASEPDAIRFGTIEGVTVDALTGAVIADVHVSAGGVSIFSNQQGRFVLRQVPVGEHQIVAGNANYQETSARAVISPGRTLDIALQLQPSNYGTVNVRVRDADTKQPLAQSIVRVQGAGPKMTDAAGTVEFERVDAGDITVTVDRPTYESATVNALLEPASLLHVPIELERIVAGTVIGETTTQQLFARAGSATPTNQQ